MHPRPLAAVLATALALGCGDPTGPRSDILEVRSRSAGLRLTNRSAAAVYYIAVERETWSLLDFGIACTDPETCTVPQVPAGQSVDVSYAQVSGYRRGAEAVVAHWHLVRRDGEESYRPDSMRTLIVRLR